MTTTVSRRPTPAGRQAHDGTLTTATARDPTPAHRRAPTVTRDPHADVRDGVPLIVLAFIIGGSFRTEPSAAFPVNPTHWYVAFTVVIGATGLIMLPVHIASYRERGVLRRFAASGFPRWSFARACAPRSA